ncbi:MAG: putative signal transducing protein [bacterium]|jgi:hypothetical protein
MATVNKDMLDPTNENLIPVCITNDQVQESLIAGALEQAGLHYVVQNFDDAVFTGTQEQVHGHSRILVFEHEIDKAREIVDSCQIENE